MTPSSGRSPIVRYEAGSVFRGYLPTPPLHTEVALIWMVDGPAAPFAERVLPNGVLELILSLGVPQRVLHDGRRFTPYRRAWVAGLQRGPLDISAAPDAAGPTSLVGIRFAPGGAKPYLDGAMDALTDGVHEWEGREARWVEGLRERLFEAEDDLARLEAVETALLQRRLRGPPMDPRVRFALGWMQRAPAGLGVAQLCRTLGMSRKHLHSLFRRDVGLPPKSLQRILRFQSVLRAVESGGEPLWADLAHCCGYSDQAHLIHDFRAFAGVTPTRYLRSRTVDPNHLVLAGR